MPGEEGVLEIRPFNTMEDFGELLTDEHRKQIESQQKPKAKSKAKAKTKAKSKAKPKSKPAKRKPARAKSKK
jgi:hypothetical protein